jgi:hypothetical protein
MGKFGKRFYFAQIPEWRGQYIDYKSLYQQIKVVKAAVLELAQAYAHIKEITGDVANKEIQLEKMKSETDFWKMMDNSVDKVEIWYLSQMEHFTEQFHILTLQAIQLQLIEEYIPFTRGLSTRLERELDRLHLGVDIELSTISKKDEAKKPLVRENTLIALSKKTTVSDLLKRMRSKVSSRMRSAGQSRDSMNARLLDNQGSSDETGGDSGYDSDKSISVEGEHSSSESFDEDDIDAIKRQNQLAAVIKASKEDAYKKKSAEPATKSSSGKKKSVTIDSKAAKKKKKKGSDEDAKEDVKKGSESDDLKKPHKSYTVLRLRNLTREDIESTDMSRSSFVVHQELQDIGKIDRNAAQLRLRKAFAEFYRGLCLLQNYVTVNLEGIEKILSKHDKNIELGKKDQYISDVLSKCAFYRRVALTTLMRETEHVFAMAFTSGHRTAAMKKLRVANKEKASQVSTFRFGLFFGVSLTLLAIIAYMSTLLDAATVTRIRPILIMYRMTALCVFMLWGWGVDMWMWSKFRVNYIFIFEFDPRRHHRYAGIFEAASVFSVFLISSVTFFLFSQLPSIHPAFQWIKQIPLAVHPLVAFGVMLLFFIGYSIKSKFWLIKYILQIIVSPFTPVNFPHFFLADQLISITTVLHDLEYFICYLVNDAWNDSGIITCDTNYRWILPMLSFLPPFWRFMQCLRRYIDTGVKRQLVNAAKYSCSFAVITFAYLRGKYSEPVWLALWIVAVAINTMFTFTWDVKMDWSVGDFKAKYPGLRESLLYPVPIYYVALCSNLFMRLMWTLQISPEATRGVIASDAFSTILALIEVCRRCFWNLFRVENEQINNIGKFRALNEVPLPLPVKNPFEEEEDSPV